VLIPNPNTGETATPTPIPTCDPFILQTQPSGSQTVSATYTSTRTSTLTRTPSRTPTATSTLSGGVCRIKPVQGFIFPIFQTPLQVIDFKQQMNAAIPGFESTANQQNTIGKFRDVVNNISPTAKFLGFGAVSSITVTQYYRNPTESIIFGELNLLAGTNIPSSGWIYTGYGMVIDSTNGPANCNNVPVVLPTATPTFTPSPTLAMTLVPFTFNCSVTAQTTFNSKFKISPLDCLHFQRTLSELTNSESRYLTLQDRTDISQLLQDMTENDNINSLQTHLTQFFTVRFPQPPNSKPLTHSHLSNISISLINTSYAIAKADPHQRSVKYLSNIIFKDLQIYLSQETGFGGITGRNRFGPIILYSQTVPHDLGNIIHELGHIFDFALGNPNDPSIYYKMERGGLAPYSQMESGEWKRGIGFQFYVKNDEKIGFQFEPLKDFYVKNQGSGGNSVVKISEEAADMFLNWVYHQITEEAFPVNDRDPLISAPAKRRRDFMNVNAPSWILRLAP
jgi:hypothetical protein